MKKRIVITCIGTIIVAAEAALSQVRHISTAHAVLAQAYRPEGQSSGRTPVSARTMYEPPLPPALGARFVQSAKLDAAAEAAMNSGNYAEAKADARQSLQTSQDPGFARETLASALYAQGRYEEAFQEYKTIADAGGDFPRNLLPYAMLLLKSGHWAQAVAAYDKALPFVGGGDLLQKNSDFSPNVLLPAALSAAIHIGMGLTMDGGGFHGTYQERCAQALTHFQQAQALEPNNALTHYYYGYGLQKAGQWAQAQAAFQNAMDLGSGDVKTAAQAALKGQ